MPAPELPQVRLQLPPAPVMSQLGRIERPANGSGDPEDEKDEEDVGKTDRHIILLSSCRWLPIISGFWPRGAPRYRIGGLTLLMYAIDPIKEA